MLETGTSTVITSAWYPAFCARETSESTTDRSRQRYSCNHSGPSAARATSSIDVLAVALSTYTVPSRPAARAASTSAFRDGDAGEPGRRQHDRQRKPRTDNARLLIATSDVLQVARPKGETVEGLAVSAKRDLALSAALDEVEREPRKPLLREQPHVLHARCGLESQRIRRLRRPPPATRTSRCLDGTSAAGTWWVVCRRLLGRRQGVPPLRIASRRIVPSWYG